jgi:hypothetical protein
MRDDTWYKKQGLCCQPWGETRFHPVRFTWLTRYFVYSIESLRPIKEQIIYVCLAVCDDLKSLHLKKALVRDLLTTYSRRIPLKRKERKPQIDDTFGRITMQSQLEMSSNSDV